LVFQLALACIVAAVFLTNPLIEVQARSLYLPFFKVPVVPNMGWLTLVFFAFIIVGSSNAVNLTDGSMVSRSAARSPSRSLTRCSLMPLAISASRNTCRSRSIPTPVS